MEAKKYNSQDALKRILKNIEEYYPGFNDAQKKLVIKAFDYAKLAHEGQFRSSGFPYFSHITEATEILLSIKPDIETILACILHDVLEDTSVTGDQLEAEFGLKIRFLCEGVEKISKVQLKENENFSHAESIQKLFIAVAQDIRVVFVKLADRIHNLRTLEFVPKEKQERIAQESLQIYAPVADKLGLFEFKIQIEDLCLKHLQPEIYRNLEREIASVKRKKHGFLERAKKEILMAFQKEALPLLELQGRQKNLASVFNKMKRRNYNSVLEIYDLFGFRVIVKTKDDCYRALGILHTYWKPMPNRFKDYIAVPKPNGYQSLHTTLLGISGSKFPTEIQIRTQKMHEGAEFGPSAHWAYKKTRHSHFDEDYLKRTSWFPQNIPQETKNNPDKFFEEISQTILADRIYVFTPKGDIQTLPSGSTPVDFAFMIHSDVGSTSVGAKVNGTIKPLDYELRNGDIVEILTREGRTLNPAWLEFVKSSHARTHIRAFINKKQSESTEKAPSEIKPKKIPSPKLKSASSFSVPLKSNYTTIIIGGERDIPYKIASCCNPQAGKNIIGYKSRGPHFTIHKADCKQLNRLDPSRFLEAYFISENKFEIKAFDRVGLTRDLSTIIANNGLNIGELSSHYEYKEDKRITVWNFSLESVSQNEIEKLIRELKDVRNVFVVKQLT
ncbi:RelA/SpoT family protein [Candidatus Gracilibacteria bacterium]|nr:RelA/SpoT family protein [Candidatus Gracilibacteria bacterium]